MIGDAHRHILIASVVAALALISPALVIAQVTPRNECAARWPSSRLTLNLRDASVTTTLRLFAQQYRVSTVISNDVKGTVTVDFFRTPVSEAFQTIIDTAKLTCSVAGDVLRISSAPVPSKATESDASGPSPDTTDRGDVVVASPGATKVIVWKDRAAMEAGNHKLGWLLRDQPVPTEAAPLIACIAPSGTRVGLARLPRSYAFKVVVIEGQSKGCEGVVGPLDIKTAGEYTSWKCKGKVDEWLAKQQPEGVISDQDLERAVGRDCSDALRAELWKRNAARARQINPATPQIKPLGCLFVQHPEWVTTTQSELFAVAAQARTRQRQIQASQGLVEAQQRGIEADARFYGRPVTNLAEYQNKRRQAILDMARAEGDELDAQYAAKAIGLDPTGAWRRTQAARNDCK